MSFPYKPAAATAASAAAKEPVSALRDRPTSPPHSAPDRKSVV